MHASSVSATSWMLPVLADTPMSGTHVTPLLPVLLEPGRHFFYLCEWLGFSAAERRGNEGVRVGFGILCGG